MLLVYQLAIPTPYPVGPVNIFLIKNDPITLIDAGPDTVEGKKHLSEGLKSRGVELSQVRRVFITHSHPDHCGLAGWVSEISGAEIYVHPYELRRMTANSDHVEERMPFIIQSGLPGDKLAEITAQKDKLPRPNLDGKKINLLHGGESLEQGQETLQVLHLPGHAPGHLCLYASREGYLFSGDFMLPHITPNPMLEPDPENFIRRLPVLQQYLSGLQKVEKMQINLVWPGHGGVFNDPAGVIVAGRHHHQMQFDKIKEILGRESKNCYQITMTIYPTLKGWNIFMGISEIQAHLDYLVQQGDLQEEIRSGVIYYRLAGGSSQ